MEKISDMPKEGNSAFQSNRKKLNLACDIQPVLDNEKTGIGWQAYEISRRLCARSDIGVTLEAFARGSGVREKVAELYGDDVDFRPCRWFTVGMYKLIWPFFPLPLSCFFRGRRDARLFFNYHVPPGSGLSFVFVHDMTLKAFPETMSSRTRIMLNLTLDASCKRAKKIFTISEFSKSQIVKYTGVSPEKIKVIYCGVDTQRFNPTPAPSDKNVLLKYSINKEFFLYLGTLEPRKNIVTLVKAYHEAVSRFDESEEFPCLLIAGRKGWGYEEIFSEVKKLNLEKDVLFTDYVSDLDAPALMRAALSFVFPSLYEGFGLPPLEAMACGTPVIASNVSSLPEVVGDSGILVGLEDRSELVSALIHMAKDDNLRKDLSSKSVDRAKRFSWDSAADAIADTIKEHLFL